MPGRSKRRAELPPESRGILDAVSKADLFEVAWDMAGLCSGNADDPAAAREELLRMLNTRREGRGAKPLRIAPPRVRCPECQGNCTVPGVNALGDSEIHYCPACKGMGQVRH